MDNIFELAFRANPIMSCIVALESGVILEANESLAGLLGLPVRDVAGKRLEELGCFDDPQRLMSLMGRVAREGQVSGVEMDCHLADGRRWLTLIGAVPVQTGSGPGAILTVELVRELGPGQRFDAALPEGEAWYLRLVENFPEAVLVYDADQGRLIEASAHALRLFGCSKEQLLARGSAALFTSGQAASPGSAENIAEPLKRVLNGEAAVFEQAIRTADGRDLCCEIRLTRLPFPRRRLVRGMITDITEKVRAKEALQESERRMTTLIANLPGIAYRCLNDPDWPMEFISEGCRELTGYPASYFVEEKKSFNEIIFPEDSQTNWSQVQEAIQKRAPYQLTYRIRRAQGDIRWVLEQGRGVFDQDGNLLALEGFIMDISDQKRAEAAVRESEERLKLKLDSILLPEVEISDQDLSNMLDTPAIQDLMDHFHDFTNMAIAVLDTKGKILVSAGWQDVCTLFHRVHPQTSRNCVESDLYLAHNVRSGEFVEYRCKNNLCDVVTPLFVGGKHLANIYAGQFFPAESEVDEQIFIEQAQRYGFDREKYLAALHRVPKLTRAQVTNVMEYMVGFTELVSRLSLSNLKLAKAMSEQARYAESLRQSEAQTQQIIEHSPLPITISDTDDNITYLNKKFTQTFGYTLEDIPTLEHWLRLAYPDEAYRQEAVAIWRETLREAAQRHLDFEPHIYQVRRKDGQVRQVKIIGTVIGNKYLSILEDITERLRVEESLHQSRLMLRSVVENFPGVVFWKDCQSVYLGCNKAFARSAGLQEPEEIVGKTDDDLPWTKVETAAYQAADREVIHSGQPRMHIIENLHQNDGRPLWVDTSKVPLVDASGTVIGILGAAIDITARKLAENELIEESHRKDEFLAMLSHELRNPLAPIRNAVEVMRLAGSADDLLRRQQAIIERQIKHMARIIDDLLDVACITRGRIGIQKERIVLRDVVERAIETTTILAGPRKDDLCCRLSAQEIPIEGDPARLVQVVANLLNNAVKFSEPGQKITLSLSMEPGPDSVVEPEAVIRVEDEGMGIAPEILPKIFDLFVQADRSLDRSRGGLGLGLTLTRRIVELHGGRIEAASPGLGQGSRFTVCLPVVGRPSLAPGAAASEAEGFAQPQEMALAQRQRVLVVDDNADEVYTMQDLLNYWGYAVEVALDGPQALQKFREFNPGVLLIDIGLPGLSGNEVARAIRVMAAGAPLLLVAITGYGRDEDRRKTTEVGFDHHLTKPVDLDQLRVILEDYLRRRGLEPTPGRPG